MQIDKKKSNFSLKSKWHLLFNEKFKVHLTMESLVFTDFKLSFLTERYIGKVKGCIGQRYRSNIEFIITRVKIIEEMDRRFVL